MLLTSAILVRFVTWRLTNLHSGFIDSWAVDVVSVCFLTIDVVCERILCRDPLLMVCTMHVTFTLHWMWDRHSELRSLGSQATSC